MPGQGHFPPVMDRCVMKVKDQGHSESSAYAICRDSLGLTDQQDGSHLDPQAYTEAEIEARLKRNADSGRLYASAPSPEMTKRIEEHAAQDIAAQKVLKAEVDNTSGVAKMARAIIRQVRPKLRAAIEAAVENRKDVNPDSGTSKYGDVEFADTVNNKYPIDTEDHIRNAWSRIHQPENRSKYDSASLTTIENKIVAAWKKKVDPAGPPEAQKAETTEASEIVAARQILAAVHTVLFGRTDEVRASAKAAAGEMPALPTYNKDIVVARVGKNFRNGNQQFDLSAQNIDEIIANFKAMGKQIPLLLTPDHLFGSKKSAIPAAGWIEDMYRDGNDWHAKCKFIGDAAVMVANDQFRGVSIGTVMARDEHGKVVGEAMDHLLITNSPFFANLNIAASADNESAAGTGAGGVL